MSFLRPINGPDGHRVVAQNEFNESVEILEEGDARLTLDDGRVVTIEQDEVLDLIDLYSQRVDMQSGRVPPESIVDLLLGDDAPLARMRQALFGDREVALKAQNALSLGQYQKAIPLLIEAANAGDLGLKYQLALCYYLGRGVVQNYEMAYRLAREAAEAGYNHAAFLVAQCYYNGQGCVKSLSESFKWAEISHERGSAKGTVFLANFYYSGECVERDRQRAFNLYISVEHSEEISVPYLLGRCYAYGQGCVQDYARAFALFKRAEALNDSCAYYDLGLMYFHGRGVKIDQKEAFKYFDREYKDKGPRATDARIMMGKCYYSNQSGDLHNVEMAYVIARELIAQKDPRGYYGLAAFAQNEKRYAEGVKYLQLAADAQFMKAHVALGAAYFFGEGVKVDYKKAFRHLSLVKDDPDAFQCLGLAYLSGYGVAQNIELGVEYLQKSSDAISDNLVNIKLGNMYFLGTDVPRNYELAKKYLERCLNNSANIADSVAGPIYCALIEIYMADYFNGEDKRVNLDKAMICARKLTGISVADQCDEMSVRVKLESKEAMKSLNKSFQKKRLKDFGSLPQADFATVLKIDLFSVKQIFEYYFQAYEGNRQHQDFTSLQDIYTFLYSDLDQSWELFSKEQLRIMMKVIFKITDMMSSTANAYISRIDIDDLKSSQSATPEEVAESFLPIMPKKKPKAAAKPKGAQKKGSPKKVPAPQQTPTAPKLIPQSAVNQNREAVVIPEVKSISPPKASVAKAKISAPLESPIQKMLSIAQSFKAAQDAVVAYYSKDVNSSLRKSIEAVFDKKSISQDKVIALMEHLAEKEQGSCVKNANGGVRLIVGELSAGCHAFHGPGDKNHLGFIAELRKLMVAVYQKKQDAVV